MYYFIFENYGKNSLFSFLFSFFVVNLQAVEDDFFSIVFLVITN